MLRLAAVVLTLVLAPAIGPAPAQDLPETSGTTPDDRLGFLRTVTVESGETVRDAVCVFCPVVVRGTVERDAVAVWGGVDVEGKVGADAVAVGGALRVSGDARVEGDPVAIGGPVEVAPGGTLVEEETALGWLHCPGQRQLFALGVAVFVVGHLLIALVASLLLGERRVAHLTAVWLWSPGRTLLRGLLVFSAVVAAISLAGAAGEGAGTLAGIVGGTALMGAFTLGLPAVALVLGRRVRPELNWRAATLLGAFVVAIASLIPLAGLAVSLALWCAVCGLAVRGIAYRRPWPKSHCPEADPEDDPGMTRGTTKGAGQ